MVEALHGGPQRFNDLLGQIPGIAANILSEPSSGWSSGQGHGPGADHRGTLGLGVYMMRRAPRPTLRGFSASHRWTCEGDLVLSVHNAGPQVLSVKVSWRAWKRPALGAACTGPATQWGQTGRYRPHAEAARRRSACPPGYQPSAAEGPGSHPGELHRSPWPLRSAHRRRCPGAARTPRRPAGAQLPGGLAGKLLLDLVEVLSISAMAPYDSMSRLDR